LLYLGTQKLWQNTIGSDGKDAKTKLSGEGPQRETHIRLGRKEARLTSRERKGDTTQQRQTGSKNRKRRGKKKRDNCQTD